MNIEPRPYGSSSSMIAANLCRSLTFAAALNRWVMPPVIPAVRIEFSMRTNGRFFAATLFLIVCVNGCTPAPGRLVFEPSELDVSASELLSGEQEVTVGLRNAGGGPLDIADVKPSCACTVMNALETTHLEKGAAVAVKLRVSPPVYGQSEVMVVAQATSLDVPPAVLSLHLHGSKQVPRVFTATRNVHAAGTSAGEELIALVDLLTDEPATATAWVTGLESSSPEVTSELVERKMTAAISEDFSRFSYTFVVRGPTPAQGTLISNLTPQTAVPQAGKNKNLPRIQVTREFAPVVRALPGELLARRRGNNVHAECHVAIIAEDEAPFDLDFDGAAEWITVSTEANPGATSKHRHALLVQVDMNRYPALADDGALPVLVVSTTHPKCKEVHIPVRLLVE